MAAVVGVDSALVIRYFGSKEGLFSEAVARGFDPTGVIEGGHEGLGERLARSVVQKEDKEAGFDPLLALLRSAPNARAAAILREGLDDQFVRPLAESLGGEHAEERAGLIAAELFGRAFMRTVIKSRPLATSEVEHLVSLVSPILQGYVDE